MPKSATRNLKLTDELISVIGSNPDDIVMSMVLAAQLLVPLFETLQDALNAVQWRALAHAIDVSTYKQNLDPLRRIELDIEESYDADNPEIIEEIKKVIAPLSPVARWGIIATIDFGKRHFATRIDSAEWWSLETRQQTFTSAEQGNSNSKPRRQTGRMTEPAPTVTKA